MFSSSKVFRYTVVAQKTWYTIDKQPHCPEQMLIYHLRLWPSTEYRIAGKFSLVQIFVYLAKKPTEWIFVCFNFAYQSYKTTPMPTAYIAAWWSRSRFMIKPFSFYFDCTTDQESLGRQAAQRFGKTLAARIQSSCVARSKFTQKFLIAQIFVVFIFACGTRMRNMWKSAPCKNFPLYSICFSSPKTFMRTCTCQQMHEKRFLGSRTASTFHSSLNMHCVNQFLVWISCLWCLCFNMNLEIFFFRCIW